MADFAKVAKEVMQVLQSFDYTVMLYDDEGMTTHEVVDARRFFARPNNLMVAILDDGDNSSIELSFGKTTHANDIMGLDLALKTVATKFSLIFAAKQFGKQIEPKDVTTLGSFTEAQDTKMILSLTEGMYGTTRSSYLRLENAKMIVRHSRKINDSMIGARGRCVESIFIENASGERLLFPSTQLGPARAMAQHVNQGNVFDDPVGEQIIRMTNEYSNLSQASNYVANNTVNLAEGAMAVREACRGKMRGLRKTFERLARATSYVKEAESVLECSKKLNEHIVDETRLAEIRQLLNGADLSKEVYECASRAMDEMKEGINERDDSDKDGEDYVPNPATTVGVLGYRVDKEAWNQLKNGFLVVTGPKKAEAEPVQFPDKFSELCFKVGSWVPVVADVTMANLLGTIVDKMSIYKDTGEVPDVGIAKDPAKEEEWKRRMAAMATIALKAMKARKVRLKKPNEAYSGTGAGVPAVAEHFNWLSKFDPEQILAEDFSGLGDWGDPVGDGYDDVKSSMINDFDADAFANSPEVHDMVGDKNPSNPDEHTLSHDDVMTALRNYVHRDMHNHGGADSFSLYMTDTDDDDEIVDGLFDQACEALQQAGWVVADTGNTEVAEADDFDGFDDDEFGLSQDDIMMPVHHQGNSLYGQVSKATVDDPEFDDKIEPDSSYINRLMTLAGVHDGGY